MRRSGRHHVHTGTIDLCDSSCKPYIALRFHRFKFASCVRSKSTWSI